MKKLLHLIALSFLVSCQEKENLTQFEWMKGEWINDDDSLTFTKEYWNLISNTKMEGYGMTLSGSDTLFFEKMMIEVVGSEIIYTADVGEGPIEFKLTLAQDKKVLFENPANDFPKQIIYSNEGNAMTVYTAAGPVTIPFTFKRPQK
jgi:hypothetical protein